MKVLTDLKQTINGKEYSVYFTQGARRKTYFVKIGRVFTITAKADCN